MSRTAIIALFSAFTAFPATGNTNILYIATDINVVYRWNGSAYISVSGTLTGSYTTATDPALNAAVSTAIVDVSTGVIITTTGASNAQTIQSPTVSTAGRICTVVNNDMSSNSITVNAVPLAIAASRSYVWDGSAWVVITPVTATQILNTPAGGISAINVQTAINELDTEKANLASPTFTGTPTLPTGTIATTQTDGNSTTALATTAFVTTADNLKANLAGTTTFTGSVTCSGVGGLTGNSVFGTLAMQSITSGTNNTALGFNSLYNCTTGSGNIALGARTGAGSFDPVFSVTTQSDRVVMGSIGVTNAYVQVAWTVVSDARDKTNFGVVPHGLDFVKALQPISYQFRQDRDSEETNGGVKYGFKAQDILELEGDNPVIVDNEDLEKLRMIDTALIPVLVNAIKELEARIAVLESAK